jgi:sugar phosphate isomerase/epimerase
MRKAVKKTAGADLRGQAWLAPVFLSYKLHLNKFPMLHPIFESGNLGTRRQFLQVAGALTIGTTCGQSLLAAATPDAPVSTPQPSASPNAGAKQAPLMQIGILLGTFGRPTLAARLDAAKICGLDCVQVSLDCAGLPAMPDDISAGLAGEIRREAAARGITIAALQGTFNMSHPDAEHRQTGLRRLRVLARACHQVGTSRIHLCTGTRDRENMWRRHPDNDLPSAWRDMAACMREAAEIARQAGVILAFEPEVNNVVDSAAKARRLLDEIGSPHLKVTIDPANIFHTGELPRMSEILDEAFALVGKDIVLAHAKDLDHDGDAGHKAAGQGKLDYDRYLSLLHSSGFKGPLLLHGLSEAQVPGCVAFLREKLARVGLGKSAPRLPGK